ncbi:MAG TPA: hypothetical protein VGS96_16450 [Thermoanaerobaculia bacterium]|jgi:hypothetical protein|nr:hypothetical protein [Thermoanaerobaculia bacterium]
MKRIAVCVLLLLAACSSATNYPVTPPDVEIVQLYGPSNLDFSRGVSSIDAEYGIQVTNRASDPIRLRHVTLESVAGTTIVLRREDRAFDNEIPPGQTGQARMHARVYFTSDFSGSPTREPLTIRATLRFDSPKGSFNKIVQRNIGQFPGQ